MARPSRNPMNATFGSNAYDLDFYGDVVAVPAPQYAPPQTQTGTKTAPETQTKTRTKTRARVKVRVREQQAVAPFAICGFLAVVAVAVVLLMGYVQLNGIYSDTVELQSQLTRLQSEAADLEAQYETTFDRETLERAVAADGTLTSPSTEQSVYVDLSEPDNAVVYEDTSGGLFHAIGQFFRSAVEFFR